MASETKHTPGPWHVANGVQVRSARDQIAKVWMMRNGEGKANARLIAAAPELYEALVELLLLDVHGNTRTRDEVLMQCSDAIAKAKGIEQ